MQSQRDVCCSELSLSPSHFFVAGARHLEVGLSSGLARALRALGARQHVIRLGDGRHWVRPTEWWTWAFNSNSSGLKNIIHGHKAISPSFSFSLFRYLIINKDMVNKSSLLTNLPSAIADAVGCVLKVFLTGFRKLNFGNTCWWLTVQ